MLKQLIINNKYIDNIQSNGSVIIVFDYFSYDFTVNEVHFFNFFLLDLNNFTDYFLRWDNLFNYFFSADFYYFNIFHLDYLVNNNLNLLDQNSYELKELKFFFDVNISNKETNAVILFNLNTSIFFNKYCFFFDIIYTYNNFDILKFILFYSQKVISNIFYNI